MKIATEKGRSVKKNLKLAYAESMAATLLRLILPHDRP